MRYAWDQFESYFGADRIGRWKNAAARLAMAPIARWDRATAHRVDRYIANSHYVAGRIARYYNRQSTVLHPPVDTEFFTPDGAPSSNTFLVVSALVPYKRLELAIDAANRTGVTLNIVGSGPDEPRLRAHAGDSVHFLGSVDSERLRDLYRRSRAVVLPGEEDFGIVPVEAMACGRPVIALGRGGALETVVHGKTGLLCEEASVDAFANAMTDPRLTTLSEQAIRSHAENFDRRRFESAFAGLVAETIAEAPVAC
jgi:glycosyltransferase involved in cell wall biosynthesis